MAKPHTTGGEPPHVMLTGDQPEPLAVVWSRRAKSFASFGVLTVVFFATAPLLVAICIVIDCVRSIVAPHRSLPSLRALAFFTTYFVCEWLGLARALWLWVRHVLRGADADHADFIAANVALQRWWAATLRRAAFLIFRLTPHVTGAEHCETGPVIALFRHCSVADTVLPTMLLSEKNHLILRWVLKRELLWDPCMDVVGCRLRNAFVSRAASADRDDIAPLGKLTDGLDSQGGVVIYPEGTRFTTKKRHRIIEKCEAAGDTRGLALATSLTHVLPPRLGGTLALLDNNDVRADVLFCAHTGLESIATFGDLWNGRVIGKTVRIHLWRVPFAQIPSDRKQRIAWLLSEWRKVDAFIASVDSPIEPAS